MTFGKFDWSRLATSIAALIFGAVIWQLVSLRTSPAFLASFTATVARIVEYTRNGVLVDALASSLLLFVTGFGFAVVIGVLIGLLLGALAAAARGARELHYGALRDADGGTDPVHPVDHGVSVSRRRRWWFSCSRSSRFSTTP